MGLLIYSAAVFTRIKYIYQLISHLSVTPKQNHNSVAKTFFTKKIEKANAKILTWRELWRVGGGGGWGRCGISVRDHFPTQTVNQSGLNFVRLCQFSPGVLLTVGYTGWSVQKRCYCFMLAV